MTEVGQKKQKKKGTKMALSDFLADQSTGSWADEMDDLPSAPSAVGAQDNFRSGGFGDGGRGGFQSRGGFGDREESRFTPRAPVELPTRPPYTIHLGNLPFDVTEADIEDFFSASKINSIRIMKDFEDKPKGFGYVEFDSLDSLKKALENNGQSLCGRNVRVSVAEPPREREVREDRSAGEWRREAPVPPAGNRFGGSSSNDRFERSIDRGAPREFGSRFNNSERPPDRTDVNTWRRETPLPAAETSARPGWEKPREREHRDTSWSGGAFTSRAPPAPVTRRKLELKPRSSDAPAAGAAEPAATKASPFGAARPIDNDEAIRRVEEKLKQEQQQKKEAAEKARKEKESKKEVAGDKKEKTVEEAKEAEVQA
ncbi:translation initiation factor 4B [Entomortierella parvispora]|uniref:Translation initiation factor 4B n=1 Tax=Entomortierella parvispora TaxID=205924 RepID=A0A9P3HHK0_9FUNG|nr:translation initiation factor 4B [Entomortierella parvispora]